MNGLRKNELLSLAQRLRVDVTSIVTGANTPGTTFTSDYRIIERLPRSDTEPRFSGTLDFDLALELFGRLITKRARIVWKHTPEWEFFDLRLRRLVAGSGNSKMHAEVLIEPPGAAQVVGVDGELRADATPLVWTELGLFTDGLLPEGVLDEIDKHIERMCREEDARRRAARQVEGTLPAQPSATTETQVETAPDFPP